MAEVPPWLAGKEDQVRTGWVKRFRPEFWTVDFPRPMMAAFTFWSPTASTPDEGGAAGSGCPGKARA